MPRPGPRATAWRTLQKRGTQPGGAQGAVGEAVGDRRLQWQGVVGPLGVPSSLPQDLSHCCWQPGPLLSCSKAPPSPGTEAHSVSLAGIGYGRWGSIPVPGQIASNSEIPSIKGPGNLWTHSHLPSPNSGPCCPEKENAFPKVTRCMEPGLT